MAGNSDDLLISVSTDLTTVKRQLRQLGQDITAATGGIQKQFDTVGKGIDRSMTTALQARVNEMVGIGTKGAKEWQGALANQGQEFERLRAKINPLFATISRYKASVGEIQAAHRIGAISANEMTAAMARERTAALASIAAIKGRNTALADTPVMRAGKGANAFNTANVAAQFQDIAVMAQMGIANPLTIALQQGTQLSAVFNQMGGARDVIKGIGAAFLSIVNPVSLVTIGTIAAGVAAYNYFSASEEGAEATEKALKDQADLIDRVVKKWGDALPAIRAYADEQDRVAGKADVEGAFKGQYKNTFKEIGREVSSAGDEIQGLMDLLRNAAPVDQIVAMQGAFVKLSESAVKNKTTVEEMDAAHKALMDLFNSTSIPVFKETADAIAALTPKLAETNTEMERLAAQEKLGLALEDIKAAINGISSSKAREELSSLLESYQKNEKGIDAVKAALDSLSGTNLDLSGPLAALGALWEAAEQTAAAVRSVQSKQVLSPLGTVGPVFSSGGKLIDENELQSVRADSKKSQFQIEADKAARKGGDKSPKKTADDRFFEDIEAIRQRTRALAEETNMVGMSFEAQTKRRAAFDLEQKALKDVREEARKKGDQDWQNAQLSPDQVAKINEVSDAYAKQAETLRRTQEAQAELADWMNLGRSATRGFIDDMLNGATAGEAFANVLGKIGDKLLDLAMNDLFGGGGGGGGILGALFGGFGGGGGFKPTAGGFAQMMGIPGYANGTNFHPGGMAVVGERGPELLNLPRGSQVIPRMPKIASGGGGGSVVVNFNPVIDNRGASAEAVARNEQQLAKMKAELPSMVIAAVRKSGSSNVKLR